MAEQYQLIADGAGWAACYEALRRAPRFAVDVEANSLHAYRERVCLLQFSTEDEDFIVDPLAGLDLSPLGGLLADPAVEKVFHSADYDLSLLKTQYNWTVCNLFDTMWAGRVLGFKKMGLAAVLEDLLGVCLSKKFQKANWARRPLPENWLDYASNDTRYLLPLRDRLAEQLEAAGRTEEALEIFAAGCEVEPIVRPFDADSFWTIQGVRALEPRAQAVFRALFVWREGEAKRRDVPPFKVINNQSLLLVARAAAEGEGPLTRAPGVSDKTLARMGGGLQQAVEKGRKAPLPKPPKRGERRVSGKPGFLQRYDALLEWRKRAAQLRGVESDVIISRRAAKELAEKCPSTPEDLEGIQSLGPYRRTRYAGDILKVIKETK